MPLSTQKRSEPGSASRLALLGGVIREQFSRAVVTRRAAFLCAGLAIVIGFTNPLAMSLTEVLFGVMAVCWLLSGDYGERLNAIKQNPVALASLALVALLSLSLLYGEAPWRQSLHGWARYRNLVYLVLFITIFRTARLREAGLLAFYAAMIVTLASSISTALGVPPIDNRYTLNGAEATVFRGRIIHGLCMALFAYLMTHHFLDRARWRWITGPLALLAIFNTLFMVGSRTAYVVLVVLFVLLCVQRLRLRHLAYVAVTAAVIIGVGFFHSDTFSQRLRLAREEIDTYLAYRFGDGPIKPEGWKRLVTRTSCGIRLDWYRAGLQVWAKNPLLGVGVGNIRHHLAADAKKTGVLPSHNLHSEYVMVAAQNGLLGLGLWVMLFVAYWRNSRLLSPSMRHVAQGMLAVVLVAGIANSILTERTQGVLFAFCSGLAFAELSERATRKRERAALHAQTPAGEDACLPRMRAA